MNDKWLRLRVYVFGYGPVASWSSILAIYGPVFKDSSREMPDASESLKTLLDDID